MVESCVKALVKWVSRHGVPQIITSDNGTNFTAVLWNTLAHSLRTKIMQLMAHNPEVNSIVNRLHHSLKAALTARCQGGSWRNELPWVLLGIRTTLHTVFNAFPAEVLYGQALMLPADAFQEQTSPTSPSDTQKVIKKIMPAKTT
ncbi:uncharacterized protein [Macrobrachium rosenbergii]|uniref:uncharacterized protein n=1 Tax=Macrobrachium rosenbergii TaxID=79674 RepID=UPI0034D61F8B